MSLHHWIVPLLWLAAVSSVAGQTTDVTQCISSYGFSINALGQNPCLVAAFLESACGTPTNIPAIPDVPGDHYLGPNATEADPCRCSSVTYSMISACAGCQNRTYTDWLTWNENCPEVSFTTFPKPLPANVEVPSWAFLNLTLTGNNFSTVAAEQNASASAAASAASASASSAIMTSTSVLTPTLTPTASASKSKSNAGAIAGGVVGGLVFIAIVTLGALWFRIRRKRNMVQENASFDNRALVSGTAMSQTTGSTPGPQASQSIYTSDRSVYPASDLATSGVFTSGIPPSRRSLESLSLSLAQFGGGPQTQTRNVPGGYTGRAEI